MKLFLWYALRSINNLRNKSLLTFPLTCQHINLLRRTLFFSFEKRMNNIYARTYARTHFHFIFSRIFTYTNLHTQKFTSLNIFYIHVHCSVTNNNIVFFMYSLVFFNTYIIISSYIYIASFPLFTWIHISNLPCFLLAFQEIHVFISLSECNKVKRKQ